MRFSYVFLFISFFYCFPLTASEVPYNLYSFGQVAEHPSPLGVAGAISGISNNALIIAGGSNFPDTPLWEGGKKKYYSDINIFIKTANGIQCIPQKMKLPKELGYSAAVSAPQGIICLGGETAEAPVKDAFILRYEPQTETVNIISLPDLPSARTAASAAVLGNRVYIIGGKDNEGKFLNEVLSLSLSINTNENVSRNISGWASAPAEWRSEPALPQNTVYSLAVTQSNGEQNRIYLFGGRCKFNEYTRFYRNVYSLSSSDKQWQEELPLSIPLATSCGCAVGTSSIFIFGGDDGNTFNLLEAVDISIAAEKDSEIKGEMLNNKKAMQKNHEGFYRKVIQYNTITKTYSIPFEMPFRSQVTTAASVWSAIQNGNETAVVIPAGEIQPAVRTNKINVFRISSKSNFHAADYAVLAVYLAAMLGIGFLFVRKNGTSSDFFFGGGRLPWWAVGISIFATTLSSITFLSMPAKCFATDWRMFFYNFGILMTAPVVIFIFLPYFRHQNIETAYEYLERRFNRSVRYFASALFILFMISRIAVVLFLPSLALSTATGLNVYSCIIVMSVVTLIYCTLGGMEAVVWSDVIQGFILVGGAVLSAVVLIINTDSGLEGFFMTGVQSGKFHCFDFQLDLAKMTFWTVLIGGFCNQLITYSSDQTLVQRYMCCSNDKQTVRSIWLNAFIAIPVTFVFFLIGTALFTYYHSHPERFDAAMPNTDEIYPLFIVNGLPPGISGLVIAAVFAAAMSTLSANVNSASSAVYSDFIKVWFPKFALRHQIGIPQIAGVVIGTAGTLFALALATFEIKSLWDLFNTFLGLFTGPVGGLFLLGVFTKRCGGNAALAGVIGSAAAVAVTQYYTNVSFLLYGFIGMTVCCVIGFATGLLTQARSDTI